MSGEKGVTPLQDFLRERAAIRNSYISSALAEFLGSFIFCLFAVGAGCQEVLLQSEAAWFTRLLGTVLGLMAAITIVGGVSGGHCNPAVTLGVAISGGLSWIKVPLYWFAQFLGAYMGSGLAYWLYLRSLRGICGADELPENCPGLVYVFAPLARPEIGVPLVDQVIGTALFVMVILAACDKRNMEIPSYCYGPLFATTLLGINCAFGVHAGGVLNPSRDIGARLMAVTVGYDANSVFTSKNTANNNVVQYWVAPFFGPLIGGAIAAFIYNFLIAGHLSDKKIEELENTYVANRFNMRARLDDQSSQAYYIGQQSGKNLQPYRSGQ